MKKTFTTFLCIVLAMFCSQIILGQNAESVSHKSHKLHPKSIEKCEESTIQTHKEKRAKHTVETPKEAVCLEQTNKNLLANKAANKSEQTKSENSTPIRLSDKDYELEFQSNVQVDLPEPTSTYTIVEHTTRQSEGVAASQGTEGATYSNRPGKHIEDYTAEELLKVYQIGNEETKAKILANPTLKAKLLTTNIKLD